MTNELVFEVMVMELDVLEKIIDKYNKKEGTNFKIIEKIEDIFYLGQSL